MPRLSPYPIPKKRFHGSRWRIYWKWNKSQYSIPTDYLDEKKVALVDSDLRKISAALAEDSPAFPERYADHPVVLKYIRDRYGITEELEGVMSPGNWLPDYEAFVRENSGGRWGELSVNIVRRLDSYLPDGLNSITPALAEEYLDYVMKNPVRYMNSNDDTALRRNSPGTRNRTLAVCNRCFKWAVRTERFPNNPFQGIPRLSEPREDEIVYCTRQERARIINMARSTGVPDWISVPIAFYTGMRMEEVFRFDWEDIRWETGRVFVAKTKTGRSRLIDLNGKLRAMLMMTPEEKRRGFVVPDVDGASSRRNRAQNLIRLLRKIAATETNPIPPERIGWNAWRHTFATLLVHEGVMLDTVCSLMGNTPEVCRRHYAQFIPRDKRLDAIDRL